MQLFCPFYLEEEEGEKEERKNSIKEK
jgi:hypothetical protein